MGVAENDLREMKVERCRQKEKSREKWCRELKSLEDRATKE
jgi:hypothetical protein